MTAPPVVHHYSYATGVSLELPPVFERVGETASSATYADLPDDGDAGDRTAQLLVQVVGTLDDAADAAAAVSGLADGFAGVDGTVLRREERTVDDEPTVTVVVRRADGQLLHLTAAVDGRRLVSIVATAPDEALLRAYDAAVESIRFIAL